MTRIKRRMILLEMSFRCKFLLPTGLPSKQQELVDTVCNRMIPRGEKDLSLSLSFHDLEDISTRIISRKEDLSLSLCLSVFP